METKVTKNQFIGVHKIGHISPWIDTLVVPSFLLTGKCEFRVTLLIRIVFESTCNEVLKTNKINIYFIILKQ